MNQGQSCEVCKARPVEPDGFCSWHGRFNENWMCDDCVHRDRARNQAGVRPPEPSSQAQIRFVLDQLDGCIRNMAMINNITGMDASTADRSVNLSLNFRESRAIYQLIGAYLDRQLTAAKVADEEFYGEPPQETSQETPQDQAA